MHLAGLSENVFTWKIFQKTDTLQIKYENIVFFLQSKKFLNTKHTLSNSTTLYIIAQSCNLQNLTKYEK